MPLNTGSDEDNHVRFCLKRTGGPATCPNIGDVFHLDKGTTVVGRNPTKSDIYLDSAIHRALISRLHARISVGLDNKVSVCDTSLNGTYVNDRKILDTAEINPGDTITFGHVKGAVLVPGTVAKQLKSEFRFKLEKYVGNSVHDVTIDPEKENSQVGKKTDVQGFIPNLSCFMRNIKTESKGPIGTGVADGTIDSLPSTADSDILIFNNYDDDELMAFAAAAEGAMDEESDTELFSVSIPSPLPADIAVSMSPVNNMSQKTPEKMEGSRQIDNACTNVMLDLVDGEENSRESTHENISKQGKSSKRPRRKSCPWITKKRKHSKTNTSYEEPVPDTCGFGSDCLCPHQQHEIVNWVQCDFCEKWYHLECAGLTIDTVTGQLKKFNCGCS